jgi:hypothetical protein
MRLFLPLLLVALSGCSVGAVSDDQVFTLYRSRPIDANMRIDVASFDAVDGEKYNRENCELAIQLFKAQPGVHRAVLLREGSLP